MSTLSVATIKSQSSAAPVFQNSSGTEKGILAAGFVNFQGTGTVAIRDSFNVSSITDIASGKYQVNFTNALSNNDYSIAVSCAQANEDHPNPLFSFPYQCDSTMGTSAVRVKVGYHSSGHTDTSVTDRSYVFVTIFGDT